MKEAFFYEPVAGAVECGTCWRHCRISEGRTGFCGVRKNVGGKLFLLTYGRPCAVNVDPVEKKPFFHFWPGSSCLSVATVGCNLHCLHCFLPGTKVIANPGIINIEEIAEGQKVMTDTGKFKSVTRTFKHDYAGEAIRIRPMFFQPIICTPDHKLLATADENNPPEKVPAAQLTKKHFLVVPKPKNSKLLAELNVKEKFASYDKPHFKGHIKYTKKIFEQMQRLKSQGKTSREIGTIFEISGAHVRNLFSKYGRHGDEMFSFSHPCDLVANGEYLRFKGEKGKGIKPKIKITKSLARLLGLYCAEGSVTKCSKRPNSFSVVFAFGRHEQGLVEESKTLLKDLFEIGSYTEHRRTGIALRCGSSSVALFFKLLCGERSLRKKVPTFMFKCNKEIIGAFLKGYFDGDGVVKEKYTDAISVSEELIYGVAFLLLSQGVVPAIYKWVPAKTKLIEGRLVSQRPCHIVRIPTAFDFEKGKWKKKTKMQYVEKQAYYLLPIRKIETAVYNGPVFNLEVEEDHTYTANFVSVCNCQNADISRGTLTGKEPEVMPKQLVQTAQEQKCQGIAYTYTEPTVFFEYAYDTGVLARKAGLYNCFVTNGYFSQAVLESALDFLDAARIDLKGDEEHYQKVCGGVELKHVLDNIKKTFKAGVHVEIITLVIPGHNDSRDFVQRFAQFLKKLSPDVAWHFTRFYPAYRMLDVKPTPVETLKKMRKWALDAGMNYVYSGNVRGDEGENTYCPHCGALVIERTGFGARCAGLSAEKACAKCGEKIPIVGAVGGTKRGTAG